MIQLAPLSSEHWAVIRKITARLVERLVVPDLGDCWEWTGSCFQDGYGQIGYRRTKWRTHRLVYHHCVAGIPSDLLVLHRCDNPKCVRPGHLFLGTHQDNVRDKSNKGRTLTGENHPMVKLSDLQVEEIRNRVASGEKQKDVAASMGVSRSHVCGIVKRNKRA